MTAPQEEPGRADEVGVALSPLRHAPELKETGRLESFSDGVFAVAITLLVLDLKVPKGPEIAGHGGLVPALLAQWPTFLAYLTSFLTILVMWVNHHTLFAHIRRSDHRFLYINGTLLLFVTFVPFATSLLAEHIHDPAASRGAAAIYAGNFVLTAIVYNLLWRYASDRNRLLAPTANRAVVDAITHQYRFGPAVYLLAFALAFVSVPASAGLCMALALFFAFTGAFIRRAEGG